MFNNKNTDSDLPVTVVKQPRPLVTCGFIFNIILTVISFILKSSADLITQIAKTPVNFIEKFQEILKKIPVAGGALSALFSPLKIILSIPYKLSLCYAKISGVVFYILLIILIITIIIKIFSRIKYKKDKKKLENYYKNSESRLTAIENKIENEIENNTALSNSFPSSCESTINRRNGEISNMDIFG